MYTLKSRIAALGLASLLAILIAAPSAMASEQDAEDAVQDAIDWLLDQQADDGGFPGFDGDSDPGATADAVVALAAAGIANDETFDEIDDAIEFLRSTAQDYAESQGGAAKLALAFAAAGEDPGDLSGIDLVTQLNERATNGVYEQQVFIHATAMLAVLASEGEIVDGAVEFLADQQIEDGSWAFSGETDPGMGDTNTTSIAIQALVATAGHDHEAVSRGIAYLESAQLDDGSFVYAIGAEDPPIGDSNSTALALQAMIAAGLNTDEDHVADATAALLAFQNESGALAYREDMPEDSALSTAQGVPAMLGMPLPITTDGPVEATDEDSTDDAAIEPGDPDRCDYFDLTGHNLCHGFRDFWWANGGLAIFGYPLTEEFDDVGANGNEIIAQYFERARFEFDPGAPEGERVRIVDLGPAVIENLEQTEIMDLAGPCAIPDGAEHSICGGFLEYWNEYGGQDIFGLPITEPFGSRGMTVQIFERARFEHQPGEWPERLDVLLGRIGAEVLSE